MSSYSRIKCPNCDNDFGQECKFLDHITDVHGITDYEQLYVDIVLLGIKPKCLCGCGKDLPYVNWKKGYTSKYVRGHNAINDSVYLDKERQKQFVKKRKEGYASGRNSVWNKGLTKETSDKVKSMSEKISVTLQSGYETGRLVDWRKNDPEKATIVAMKSSETMKKRYSVGEIEPWNKGLTKEISYALNCASNNISSTMKNNVDSSSRRFKEDELKKIIYPIIDGKFLLLTQLSQYRNRHQRLQLKCLTCQNIIEKSLSMIMKTPTCFKCHPKESRGQLEIYEFVKSICPDAILSDRVMLNGLELDIYVPSKKIGFEYDGLYWHSEACGDFDRAVKKDIVAKKNDIRLFRVFEDEWRDKRQIVESMIKHRLGLAKVRIGARKCKIRELTTRQRREFIDKCHIDGDAKAKISWGLFYDDKIVAAISLRRAFHNVHSDKIEVARFCCDIDTQIQGALAKLTNHAIKWAKENGYKSLMTYVDRRIGRADGYVAAGFVRIKETKPRFWWTDFNDRFNRFSIKADSKNNITQEQAALTASVVKIWGCGNVVLEKSIE